MYEILCVLHFGSFVRRGRKLPPLVHFESTTAKIRVMCHSQNVTATQARVYDTCDDHHNYDDDDDDDDDDGGGDSGAFAAAVDADDMYYNNKNIISDDLI